MIAEQFKMLSLLDSIELVVVHSMGELTIFGDNGDDGGDCGSVCVVSMGRNDNDLIASMTIDTNVMIKRARGGEVVVVAVNDNGIGEEAIVSIGSIDFW